MTDEPTPLRHKVARLRAAFGAQLPARTAEARRLLERLKQKPNDLDAATPLHLILHSLGGTGKSLGYASVAAVAERAERMAWQLVDQLSGADQLLQELERCLAELEHMPAPTDGSAAGAATPAPAFEMPALRPDAATRADKLVYICDDDPLHLALIAGQLLCFGYQTREFDNTEALHRSLQHETPALLIMDIVFPGGSNQGTEILQDLRRQGVCCPVVFVSSRLDFDARLNAIRAGGEAYFPKPVNAMELVTVLDQLISAPEPAPFRVLVVDDEAEVAQLHCAILEHAGMITHVVSQPDTVLDQVNLFRPDLVLMDMYMPKCSGREVAKLIRQIPDCVSLPIVFLSRETDKVKQFSAMSIGADGFLTKPIAPDELVMSVALRAERMRILRSLMARDSLTGLFNHTTTTQLLENAVAAARRQNTSVSFAMLDLDNFKAVNDNFGHPVGDQVLLALARVLRQRLRQSDLVGRYGGEEFAVIMHEVTPEKAHQIMDELRVVFSQVVISAGERRISCTFSCGIANCPQWDSMDAVRKAADNALYAAKSGGRNLVVTQQGKQEAAWTSNPQA